MTDNETTAAGGEGAAHDASVAVENNVGRLERELSEARAAQEAELPKRRIEAAERAVEKAEAQLAGAKDALDQAIADNDREAQERAEAEAAENAASDDEQEGN